MVGCNCSSEVIAGHRINRSANVTSWEVRKDTQKHCIVVFERFIPHKSQTQGMAIDFPQEEAGSNTSKESTISDCAERDQLKLEQYSLHRR